MGKPNQALESSRAIEFAKNLALFLLGFIFLPTNTLFALGAYLWNRFTSKPSQPQNDGDSLDKVTVLVTGVNMAKGLSLARMFHRRGHRVIGADSHSLSPGRVSFAIDAYYSLPPPSDPSKTSMNDPYLNRIVEIIHHEDIDLWVSVSDVNAAVEDAAVREIIEARTNAKAIQFGVEDIRRLHEKDAFIEHTKGLGLTVPLTEAVEDREDVINFLQRNGGLEHKHHARQYLVKPVGVDDVARFAMPLLPLPSEEATLARIDSIPFETAKCSFIIQEYITGPEFCTHALIIRGRVCAFVACRSADVLMHYSALPVDSPLSRAMLDFTLKQAEEGGENFTGHMSFDFLTNEEDEDAVKSGVEKEVTIYPIECNPRVHTATVLFNNTPEIVDEYLSILTPSAPRPLTKPPVSPTNPQQYYWVGQDFVELVLYPFYLTLFRGTMSFSDIQKSIRAFVQHVVYWKDGTFESWDPLPWLWMMHVYWPVQFAWYMSTGTVWTKVNVSTGKAFKG